MNAFDINTATGLVDPIRHFLELDELPAAELRGILEISAELKARRRGLPKGALDPEARLNGQVLAMLFAKPSTRTRVSFDVAMRQLGGSAIVMNGADLQLGRGETVADTAKVLSRYVDGIMIRTFDPEDMRELAENADVPVINGLTDRSHPCQILADILTYEEHRGPIEGAKIAWTGDGNNVAATWIQAAPAFGFEIAVACPEPLQPEPEIVAAARNAGATVTITEDADAAVDGADAVVTDTWLSMNDADNVRERRHNMLRPFQVDGAMMKKAKADAVFLHCLPAHRGEEASAEVMDGPQSAIFDEAENRLHVQKGILLWCFGLI